MTADLVVANGITELTADTLRFLLWVTAGMLAGMVAAGVVGYAKRVRAGLYPYDSARFWHVIGMSSFVLLMQGYVMDTLVARAGNPYPARVYLLLVAFVIGLFALGNLLTKLPRLTPPVEPRPGGNRAYDPPAED